jgi:hypothetical protein
MQYVRRQGDKTTTIIYSCKMHICMQLGLLVSDGLTANEIEKARPK